MATRRQVNPQNRVVGFHVSRVSRLVFWMLAAVFTSFAVYESVSVEIWGERDELAHFDFIDQLSDGTYPQPSNPISDHTAALTRDEFSWAETTDYDGTKATMGLAGWSYESQQPPLYYASLAPVLWTAKKAELSGTFQVRLLRVIGVALSAIGALLMIPLFSELHRSFDVPRIYGSWLALVMLATGHFYISALGNDVLSVALASALLYFVARFWRTLSLSSMAMLALAASAASVTKLLNAPLLLVPVVAVVVYRSRTKSDERPRWHLLVPVGALMPLASYIGWNLHRTGQVLGSDDARDVFEGIVEPIGSTSTFLELLITSSFDVRNFGVEPGWWAAVVFAVVLVAGAVQSMAWTRRPERRAEAILHLGCVLITVTIIGVALMLNRHVPGVHWYSFRHFYAALPAWTFAFLVMPMRGVRFVIDHANSDVDREAARGSSATF